MHPAMLTLLQLDAESPGSIKPSLAAKVCEIDPELLITLIRRKGAGDRLARVP